MPGQAWGLSSKNAWPVAVIAVAAIGFVLQHVNAADTLPIPWPDEAHFLWPARSLAEDGTLHAPELHPSRALRWMPPGYAVAMAGVFALTGASLTVARTVSAIALLGAGMLSYRWWSNTARWPAALAVAWLLLSPDAVAIGNVARMEALELALVTGGFAALAQGRREPAMAAFSFAALVHPAGLVFAICSTPLWFGSAWTRRRLDRVALASAAVAILAAAAWFAAGGEGTVEDLSYQLSRKSSRDLIAPWWDRRSLVMLAVLVGLRLHERTRRRTSVVLFAAACLLVRNLGQEMWYAIYDVAFFAAASVSAASATTSRWPKAPPLLAAMIGLVVLAIGWTHRPQLGSKLQWRGMAPANEPYLSRSARRRVREAINGMGTIQVLPRGDAALFVGDEELKFLDATRHASRADVLLVHTSPHQLRSWQPTLQRALTRGHTVALIRDGEERWAVIVLDEEDAQPTAR